MIRYVYLGLWKKQKIEYGYGASFLSQSSRFGTPNQCSILHHYRCTRENKKCFAEIINNMWLQNRIVSSVMLSVKSSTSCIVAGYTNFSIGRVPDSLKKKWDVYSPSVLILKNKLR